jgi:hypothetical protein
MYISRNGMFTEGGVPCQLAAALKTAVGAQADFTAYGKLAKRTATQGECDLCGAGEVALGVFVDCSPKGDSGTVETKGYEKVVATAHGLSEGDIVTTGAGGILVACAVANTPSVAELTAGSWQIDEVIDADTLLIQIDARL